MEKEWRTVENTNGNYIVSNYGEVYSMRAKRVMSPEVDKDGYLRVVLNTKDGARHEFVHRLVAKAFLPNYGNKEQVNHKDLHRDNNCVLNLEWVTAQENTDHKMLNIRGANDERKAQLWLERVNG